MVVLKTLQIPKENTSVGMFFLIKLQTWGLATCNFIKKKTPTQVFSCKICEIFESTYFEKQLRTTALGLLVYYSILKLLSEAYSNFCQTSNMELCVFIKSFILDGWQTSEYISSSIKVVLYIRKCLFLERIWIFP